MQHVPNSQFDYRRLSLAERLPAFRQMTASLYETWPLEEPETFRVEAFGYKVKDLIFNEVEFSALRFKRGIEHTRSGNTNFLVLQVQLAGSELLVMDHGIVRLLPGNIYLRDWAYPFDSKATAMRIHSVLVPRHRLKSSAMLSRKNPVLDWRMSEPDGSLLFKLWAELVNAFATVTPAQAEVLCEAFLGFVDGLLGSLAHADAPVTLRAMERFLGTNLRHDVGVEDLCRQFHTSRSTVFRMFEPHGGVKAYLGRMRMERVYADLRQADPEHVQVSEIAASWGFNDPSAFSRKFRRQFEQCPSEVLGSDFVNQEDMPSIVIQGSDMYSSYMKWFNSAANRPS